MKRLLWLSDSPMTTTGFSTQSLYLMNGLADKGWEIFYFAHNYPGQRIPPLGLKLADGTTNKFWLYGMSKEPYCKDVIVPKIRELRPDVFGVLLDTFMLFPWYIQLDFAPARTTFWYPSDGGRFPKHCENILRKANMPVAMARFGQKQVKDYYDVNSEYIPHAVDHNHFSPVSKEEKQKLKTNWRLNDKFVIGSVYRNQNRKFSDRHFKAFARFAKGKDDVVLVCHTDPTDPAAYYNTFDLVNSLGIANKVVFTGMSFYDSFTYEKMKEVYNLFDIYLSSTSGEGFGVPIVEAMSCEIPIVMPSYTTGDELVRHHKCGEVVRMSGSDDLDFFEMNSKEYDFKMEDGTIMGGWEVERGVMSISDCTDKLNKLYTDYKNGGKLIEEYGKNGRKAVEENYTWEIVTEKWNQKLTELINK